MVAVPPLSPETIPAVLTVPTAGALLVHVPPGVASESVLFTPSHKVPEPVMGAVAAVTVSNIVAGKQPVTVYDRLVVPALIAVIMPVEPAMATEDVLLVHIPPGVASDNVTLVPAHRLPGPEMEAVAVTVRDSVTLQPETE